MKNRIITISLLLGLMLVGISLAPKATFAQGTNLALNKPATASSIEGAGFEAAKAVDGSTSTRWASVDPATTAQWIYVDLGTTTSISQVILNWEAAYARAYQVQVSGNASTWTTLYSTTTGDGGIDTLGVSGSGRYVRIYCTTRGTSYGYSLWELQVYGGAPTTPPPTTPPPTTPPPTTPPATTQPGQAPYGGTAWAIPGTIQAENYDTGGEGVAYHDTTTANSGGAYRTDAVDLEATTDTGGGNNVGWTAAGEWLEYTVRVTTSGTYSLNARVASQSAGGTIHVEIDGTNVTGAIAIPSTGAWQTWTTVTRTGIPLTAGQHIMRVAMDTAGFNLNWVSLQSGTPPPTTPPPTTPPPTTPPPTTPPAGKVQWSGVRSSRYGISPFPDACGWTKAMSTMSGYFPGSTPSAAWLTGGIFFSGTNSGQDLNFPNPGGTWDSRIHFAGSDQNESYLTYFDTHGIKVFLQFEPGFAPLDQLFQVTYNRYGHHPSVIGFGVDVEWYQSQCDGCANAPVPDATAQAWENKVKSLNLSYRLFLKHFDAGNLPSSYRGNIIFVDDSQQHGSYSNFLNEMVSWANTFYPADVIYQIGYPADKPWWSTLANPIPKTIGDELARRTPQSHIGILWVDFSLRDVLPTTCP